MKGKSNMDRCSANSALQATIPPRAMPMRVKVKVTMAFPRPTWPSDNDDGWVSNDYVWCYFQPSQTAKQAKHCWKSGEFLSNVSVCITNDFILILSCVFPKSSKCIIFIEFPLHSLWLSSCALQYFILLPRSAEWCGSHSCTRPDCSLQSLRFRLKASFFFLARCRETILMNHIGNT